MLCAATVFHRSRDACEHPAHISRARHLNYADLLLFSQQFSPSISLLPPSLFLTLSINLPPFLYPSPCLSVSVCLSLARSLARSELAAGAECESH